MHSFVLSVHGDALLARGQELLHEPGGLHRRLLLPTDWQEEHSAGVHFQLRDYLEGAAEQLHILAVASGPDLYLQENSVHEEESTK